MQDRSMTPLQKVAVPVASLIAITAIGSYLTRTIKKPDELPTDIQHLITNTTRIDEDGKLVNGAWLARNPHDQEWIDASQYVVSRLTEGKDVRPQIRFLLKENCLSISRGLEKYKDSMPIDQQLDAEKTLVKLQRLDLWLAYHTDLQIPERFSPHTLASSIEQLTRPHRLTKQDELLAVRESSSSKLDRITYFALPELQKP
jgi:hypothetical protein